jgi:hypothetical protein
MSPAKKVAVWISLGLLIVFVGVPAVERMTTETCEVELGKASLEGNADEHTCRIPYKDKGLWDQGEGQFCYLVSIINSNILGGIDDSDDQFFKAMEECLESYQIPICSLQNGVYPGSYEDEIIKACKILKMSEFGEPIGLDFYPLETPWWDIVTKTYRLVDLCVEVKKSIETGGGAWVTLGGLASRNIHSVTVTKAKKAKDGTCWLEISNPNRPNERSTLKVGKSNTVTEVTGSQGGSIQKGIVVVDLTIEKSL